MKKENNKKQQKKNLELQTFEQLCITTSAYPGKIFFHILVLPFLKYIEKSVFLLKHVYNKESSLFLFESKNYCYVWWLLLFSK